jgi:DnaJ-class molecular chaperone
MKRDYYVVLGVPRSESQRGIRFAFRDLARRYHPDRAGQAGAPFFREIVEAYQVLADPPRREAYDRGLRDADHEERPVRGPYVTTAAEEPEPLVPERVEDLHGFGLGSPPLADVFGRFVQGFSQPSRRARRMEAVVLEVTLDRVQAAYGGWLPLRIPVYSPCAACHGTGGSWDACEACSGSGLALEHRPMRIRLPPRVADGTVLQIPLRGLGIHNLFLEIRFRVR